MISDAVTPASLPKRTLGELIANEHRRQLRRRRIGLLVLLVLVLFGAAIGVQLRPRPIPIAARFRTEPVSRGDVISRVSATGHLEAVTLVEVGAELSGRVVSVSADFNDHVARDQVLAHFDRKALDAQRAQARAALDTARASLEQAVTESLRRQRDYDRAEALYSTGTVTEALRDERRAAATLARQGVRAARAELTLRQASFDLANTNASHAEIRAPIDGVVITRNVDPGQTVASELQTPVLFTVAADLREMQVIAAVDEADIGAVKEGQDASFTVHAYPGRTFRATVTKVRSSPRTVHDVVTYGVELTVPNGDLALKPGMTASVHLVTGEAYDTLRVSVSALGFTPPGHEPSRSPGVWVLEQGSTKRVEVTAGVTDGELWAVTSDELLRGARVVVDLTPEGRIAYGIGR